MPCISDEAEQEGPEVIALRGSGLPLDETGADETAAHLSPAQAGAAAACEQAVAVELLGTSS